MSDIKTKKSELLRRWIDFVFGFENKRGDILDSWIFSAEGFSCSPKEFYAAVEQKLTTCKIPSMEVARQEFAQGGLLSDQRTYLRLMRERLAIVTCAAPFGSIFFFSCRTVYVPALVRLWHILAATIFFAAVGGLLVTLLGFSFAVVALIGLLFALAAVFRNASASALSDLDAFLLRMPVIATIYEDWFREDTYYRVDTRTLYLKTIPGMIQKLAEEVTGEKGIKLRKHYENVPLYGDLHQPLLPTKSNIEK
jgi:hypothetical protein